MYKNNSSFSVLYITDVSKTHEFYKAIGAEIKEFVDDKVVVKFGDFELHCILETTEPFDTYKYIAEKSGRGLGNIFYIEVENIEQAAKLVTGANGKVAAEIFENKWGGKEFLFEDLDGYKFAFYQML